GHRRTWCGPGHVGARVREDAARHALGEGGISGGDEPQVLVVLHPVSDELEAEARHRDAGRPPDVRRGARVQEVAITRSAETALVREGSREESDRVVVELAL